MSAPPYMPLYVADYLGDTRHLSTEQHGAYLLLLMAMWRAGGRLPNEGAKLARICGLTLARWAKLEADILDLFDVLGDQIGHKRIEKEFEKYTRTSAKRAEAGARGAKAKSLKTNEADPAIAEAGPPAGLEQKAGISEPEPELEIEEGKEESPPSPDGDGPPQGEPERSDEIFGSDYGDPADLPPPDLAKPKRAKRKRASTDEIPMPADWTPDAVERDFAAQLGMTNQEIDLESQNFRDYWLDRRVTRPGWTRTWQTWIRRYVLRRGERAQLAPGAAQSRGRGSGPVGFAELAARDRGYVRD